MQEPWDERCSSCKRELPPGSFVQLTATGEQLCLDCSSAAHVQALADRKEYDRG